MQYLPTGEERAWLIRALGDLINKQGHDPFVSMPIVEPSPKFFPDKWTFTLRGLDRLVRRLMQYARLDDMDPQLATFSETNMVHSSNEHSKACRVTAGVFLGIEGNKCFLAFNENAPADAEYMAGVMAHEVAHVYRTRHGLDVLSSEEDEELLTDVTAVYLGFGMLVANVRYRVRTYGTGVGPYATFNWENSGAGYLTPQAFAYLLALQFVARDLSPSHCDRLIKQLEPDQAAFTKTAMSALHGQSEELPRLLKLGPPNQWSPPTSASDVLQPLPEWQMVKTGHPVLRVLKARMGMYGVLGFIAGVVLAAIVINAVDSEVPMLLPVVGLVAGIKWGYARGHEVCSNPDCGTVLPKDDTTCPNCGGTIVESLDPTKKF